MDLPQVDPANQAGGIAKWAATAAAGYIAGKFKLGADGAATVSAIILGAWTLVAQILHRQKVAKAQVALAATSSITDPEQVSAIAKAA